MVPRVWLLALLVLPWSGCTGDDGDGTPAAPAQAAPVVGEGARVQVPGGDNATALPNATAPWNATAEGCTILVASVPLTPDEVRASVPAGFEPTPFFGAAPNTAGAAIVVSTCAKVVTPTGEYATVQEALVYVYVAPPAEYRAEGIANYRVLLRHGVDDADLLAAYALRNHTAEAATTETTVTNVGDQVEAITARASIGDLAFSFGGAVGRTGSQARTLYRIFTLEEGSVVGALDLDLRATTSYAFASAYRVEQGNFFGRPAGPALVIDYDSGDGPAYTLTPVAL